MGEGKEKVYMKGEEGLMGRGVKKEEYVWKCCEMEDVMML